jgi:hypothetical protein
MSKEETLRKALAIIRRANEEKVVENDDTEEKAMALIGPLMAAEELRKALAEVKIKVPKPDPVEVNVKMPKIPKPDPVEVNIPELPAIPPIKVPRPVVKVNLPKPPAAKVTVKEASNRKLAKEMKSIRKVIEEQELVFKERNIFEDVTFTKPLPVLLVDAEGKPYIPGQFGSGGVTRGGEVEHKKASVGRYAAVDVATSATEIVPAKADRKSVVLTHEDDDPIYIGYDDAVTTTNGTPVVANQGLTFDNYTGAVYGVISAGASDSTISIRYMEV